MRWLVEVMQKERVLLYLPDGLRGRWPALAFKKDDPCVREEHDIQSSLFSRDREFEK
jgi:hypothetical protein